MKLETTGFEDHIIENTHPLSPLTMFWGGKIRRMYYDISFDSVSDMTQGEKIFEKLFEELTQKMLTVYCLECSLVYFDPVLVKQKKGKLSFSVYAQRGKYSNVNEVRAIVRHVYKETKKELSFRKQQ